MPGTISMFVWDRSGSIRRYEINVQRDLARLSEQLRSLFPGESIAAQSNGKSIVLSGSVTHKDVIEKAVSVAAGYVDKKEEVVPLLQVQDAGMSNQVLLRVRFAEVSRNALTQLGASWYSDGGQNTIGSVGTGQFPTPFFDKNKAMVGEHQVFSDYLNLFLFDFKHQIGAVIKALQTKGLFQSLAEPNLVAESGKEASFLAGGEFPIPVAQSSGANLAISIQFKEFGVRLSFTPIVTGDRVHLKVKPEVSTLDFNNAVTLQGFRIPALSTRRSETEIELTSGQTFAIAGLMNNTVASSMQKIPGIGDIPILGRLFQSKAAQKEQTELVVIISPEILPKNSGGVTPNLPKLSEPFLPALPAKKSVDPPPPAFRTPAPEKPAASAMPHEKNPASAAATVQALMPLGRTIVHADPVAPGSPDTPASPVDPAAPSALPASVLPAAVVEMLPGERKTLDTTPAKNGKQQ
jgi:pilus assembly protein CpaC